MKKIFSLLLLASFLLVSCKTAHTTGHGDVPPGQMKKVAGSKSAKEFAPGQQKKKVKEH
jgi:hypothetical protein